MLNALLASIIFGHHQDSNKQREYKVLEIESKMTLRDRVDELEFELEGLCEDFDETAEEMTDLGERIEKLQLELKALRKSNKKKD